MSDSHFLKINNTISQFLLARLSNKTTPLWANIYPSDVSVKEKYDGFSNVASLVANFYGNKEE